MESLFKEHQIQGWERAFFQKKKELEEWKEKWRLDHEQLERALQQIKDLKEDNESLHQELAIARKVPPWVKPNISKEKNAQAKPLGPKQGHLPHPRHLPARIDRQVEVIAKYCPICRNILHSPTHWHSHAQIDLSLVSPAITTEYKIGWSYCSTCKHEVSDPFSENIVGYSLYGPRLHAHVAYWKYSLGLTLGKIQKLFYEQYKLKISTGELSEILSRMARKYKPTYDQLKTNLKREPFLHADETGWRQSGEKRWLWSFSNNSISYYTIQSTRSRAVVKDVLGEKYDGILFSDFYGAYNEIKCIKQKCWIHLLRDCKKLTERYPGNDEVLRFKNSVKNFYEEAILLKNRKSMWNDDIQKDLKYLKAATTRFAMRKYQNPRVKVLARRMYRFRNELYTSIPLGLAPQNNPGELEIRPTVLMRKTSYCNRSEQGAEDQAILMSVIRTASKKGLDFIELAAQRFSTR
jgi:transposase